VRVDVERAAERFLGSLQPRYVPKYAMAILCMWHDIPYAAGALIVGKAPNTMSEAASDCRRFMQMQLVEYIQ